ncbi:hypothetical protein J6590_067977 [Homalodisca vitripennis]|nr:hypothetical protein J6590_067977 [Homalodisca vitripennis]
MVGHNFCRGLSHRQEQRSGRLQQYQMPTSQGRARTTPQSAIIASFTSTTSTCTSFTGLQLFHLVF